MVQVGVGTCVKCGVYDNVQIQENLLLALLLYLFYKFSMESSRVLS